MADGARKAASVAISVRSNACTPCSDATDTILRCTAALLFAVFSVERSVCHGGRSTVLLGHLVAARVRSGEVSKHFIILLVLNYWRSYRMSKAPPAYCLWPLQSYAFSRWHGRQCIIQSPQNGNGMHDGQCMGFRCAFPVERELQVQQPVNKRTREHMREVGCVYGMQVFSSISRLSYFRLPRVAPR